MKLSSFLVIAGLLATSTVAFPAQDVKSLATPVPGTNDTPSRGAARHPRKQLPNDCNEYGTRLKDGTLARNPEKCEYLKRKNKEKQSASKAKPSKSSGAAAAKPAKSASGKPVTSSAKPTKSSEKPAKFSAKPTKSSGKPVESSSAAPQQSTTA
ncbi:uncharacterized protein BKCO1_4100058 [Diplodia corticola]|uniref:Uncharacterized protein n=1 Tax=Diplodia corticola TaxID=236234 RepID=A0A1J9RUG5_9PEZI|nr:uncharacterized protein BKCO1_4100058 [Diplodia corticola]OJD32071.1 hypothetical protein BKCO1_4100058 [Diplodia corticola]